VQKCQGVVKCPAFEAGQERSDLHDAPRVCRRVLAR
jgi:hypothetical protein